MSVQNTHSKARGTIRLEGLGSENETDAFGGVARRGSTTEYRNKRARTVDIDVPDDLLPALLPKIVVGHKWS